ncbi:uncharacterized protein LOC108959867 [Eucalyptus grandis]|uniref:uncharacterized protein LOC108959867 n=1 Tax=Eucalyptus grandis TaxID=71139 RepID=UPI00192EB08F|nr:uncharacterized protein LOC108959867 [Eucalyptus grandis]
MPAPVKIVLSLLSLSPVLRSVPLRGRTKAFTKAASLPLLCSLSPFSPTISLCPFSTPTPRRRPRLRLRLRPQRPLATPTPPTQAGCLDADDATSAPDTLSRLRRARLKSVASDASDAPDAASASTPTPSRHSVAPDSDADAHLRLCLRRHPFHLRRSLDRSFGWGLCSYLTASSSMSSAALLGFWLCFCCRFSPRTPTFQVSAASDSFLHSLARDQPA